MRARNSLSDPRRLDEAHFTTRIGALVRADFHHPLWVVFVWRPVLLKRTSDSGSDMQAGVVADSMGTARDISGASRQTRPDDQDHGAVAAVMTRGSDCNTSGATARVLTLHVSFMCACFAPACVYLALVCAFVSLLVLADHPCQHAC